MGMWQMALTPSSNPWWVWGWLQSTREHPELEMKLLPSIEPAWEIRGGKISTSRLSLCCSHFMIWYEEFDVQTCCALFLKPSRACVTTQGLQDPTAFQGLEKQRLMDEPCPITAAGSEQPPPVHTQQSQLSASTCCSPGAHKPPPVVFCGFMT